MDPKQAPLNKNSNIGRLEFSSLTSVSIRVPAIAGIGGATGMRRPGDGQDAVAWEGGAPDMAARRGARRTAFRRLAGYSGTWVSRRKSMAAREGVTTGREALRYAPGGRPEGGEKREMRLLGGTMFRQEGS